MKQVGKLASRAGRASGAGQSGKSSPRHTGPKGGWSLCTRPLQEAECQCCWGREGWASACAAQGRAGPLEGTTLPHAGDALHRGPCGMWHDAQRSPVTLL